MIDGCNGCNGGQAGGAGRARNNIQAVRRRRLDPRERRGECGVGRRRQGRPVTSVHVHPLPRPSFSRPPTMARAMIAARTTGLAPLVSAPRRIRAYSLAAAQQAYLEPSMASVEGITFLTLNRPEAKNAISQQMLGELEEAVEKASFDR